MTAENVGKITGALTTQIESVTNRLSHLEEDVSKTNRETTHKLDDIRPKLARLKNRKDFNSEAGYIEYVGKKLDEWDSKKYGPILVKVNPLLASGKAKHFVGYVGEPIKWNTSICKVQWFGLGNKQPESVWLYTLLVFNFR